MKRFTHALRAVLFLSLLLRATIPCRADTNVATVTVGGTPDAIAINPVTDQVYVANSSDNTVTIIDGGSASGGAAGTTTITVGAGPAAIGVNVASNKIYVANASSANVTVIDAANGNSTTTIAVGSGPAAIAVNPVTNTIYVANQFDSSVSVIDGSTDTVTTTVMLATGATPRALAVNPLTNQIYIANYGTGGVASAAGIIDGATNTLSTFYAGTGSDAVAVNATTNMIYVANALDGTVTVLNGVTGAISSASVGANPTVVQVNPATNELYVLNANDGTITVIDGTTNATATFSIGGSSANPQALVLNTAANKIYAATPGSNSLAIYDGATGSATASNGISVGNFPIAIGINPVTNRIYVINQNDGTVTVLSGLDNNVTSINVGANLIALTVNPAANQIYGLNFTTGSLAIIDGLTFAETDVPTAQSPNALAFNPVTNQIYVMSGNSNNVTVVDGTTLNTTTVNVGTNPQAIAVNPVTNQIYVTSGTDETVTVIDGATLNTTTVAAGAESVGVAVNPVTNKIYALNNGSSSLTVIDGATNIPTNISVPPSSALAVNTVTNKVYVVGGGLSSTLVVIDGATNNTTQQSIGGVFVANVAVNEATNRIYAVSAGNPGTISIIDGATDTVAGTVSAGAFPMGLTVNPVTNQIYVSNSGTFGNQNFVTVIDGLTGTTTQIDAPNQLTAIVANPVTNQIYTVTANGTTMTAFSGVSTGPTGLATDINPLPGNIASSATTAINLSALSAYGANSLPVQRIYYQFDTCAGPWTPAANGGGTGAALLGALPAGQHTLFAFAVDGQESTSVNTGMSGTIIPGQIAAYTFVSQPAALPGGPFFFQQPSVTAENTDASVTVTVERSFSSIATVDYQTVSGSAVAGTNFVATQGTLSFAQGQMTQTITVPLIAADLGASDAFFSIELSNPSGAASTIASPSAVGVYLLNASESDLAASSLNPLAPAAAPPANGSLTVTLSPSAANGQWRLFGELAWRASGSTATGLASGNYVVEFQPESAYEQPENLTVAVTAGQTATATGTYTAGSAGVGTLTVNLAPAATGGWRMVGQSMYQASGASLDNLPVGSYLIEFEAAAGLIAPSDQEAIIQATQTTTLTATYATGNTVGNGALSLVDSLTTDPRISPSDSYTGQIQTDEGYGTGFVPLDRVVVTAADVIFDDEALGYVSGIRWSYQNDTGVLEAPAQVPRGFYALDGYAMQSTIDNSPGVSTLASQQLDAAALYFLEPAARGGQSGYLASNSTTNPWLTNSSGSITRPKFFAGYPVDGVNSTTPGRLYVTPTAQSAFVSAGGSLFTSTDANFSGFPGEAGAPLFVGYNDPVNGIVYYPAAIYLGNTATTTVRAIDGPLIDLMSRAEVTANGGPNNVGGGVIQVNAGLTGTLQFALGSVNVALTPSGAAKGGARWGLASNPSRQSGEEALNLTPGSYQIVFNTVPGYTSPAPIQVSVTAGQTAVATGVYTPRPATITSRATATAIVGEPFSFTATASPGPATFSTTSTLPPGLSLDAATGIISGSATQSGSYPISLSASNSQGSAGASMLTLNVAMAGHLSVTVNGNGTVTKSLAGATVKALGQTITIQATAGKNAIFQSWTITDPNTGGTDTVWSFPTYTFEMPSQLNLQANFVANPFPSLKGAYNGLLVGSQNVLGSRGSIGLTVTSTGSFTGSIYVGGQKYSVAGALNSSGGFSGLLKGGKGLATVPLTLQLDLTGATMEITGKAVLLSDTLMVGAFLNPFTAKSPAPQALGSKSGAKYTLALPHPTGAGLPEGDGYGTVTVSPTGAVRLAGVLGDGTTVSESASLGPNGQWPFFMLLYSNGGALVGSLNITGTAATPAITGSLDWFKPNGKTLYYPSGFTTNITVVGEPLGASPLTGLNQASLTLGQGGLAQAAGPFNVTFDTKGNGTVNGVSTFALKITTSTGLFTGKFSDSNNISHKFSGVILPQTGATTVAGYGLFLGLSQQTGAVEF